MRIGPVRALALLGAALLARAWADGDAPGRPAARAAPPRGGERLLYGAPLDANREPAEALALLPGIGPGRAAAIVAARPLCSLADLDRIPGIGPATLRQLASGLAFPDPPRHCDSELRAIGD
jgi:hypothetical protein